MDVVDGIRIVVIAEGAFALGLAVFVIRLYLHANRVSHSLDRPIPGALPYHVFLIASSHSLLLVSQMVLIATRIDEPFTAYGIPIGITAFTISIVGLVDMLKFQQLRVDRLLALAQQERGQ